MVTRVPPMDELVNKAATSAGTLAHRVATGKVSAEEAAAELSAIGSTPRLYRPFFVAVAMGLTAGCLARIFGGDARVFAVSWAAGTAGLLVRQFLSRRAAGRVGT